MGKHFLWLTLICILLSRTIAITCLSSVLTFIFLDRHPCKNSPLYLLMPGQQRQLYLLTLNSFTKRAHRALTDHFSTVHFKLSSTWHVECQLKKLLRKIKISSRHWLETTHTNIFIIKNKENLLVAWVAAEKLLKLLAFGERGDQAAVRLREASSTQCLGAPGSNTTAQRNSYHRQTWPNCRVSIEHNWKVTVISQKKTPWKQSLHQRITGELLKIRMVCDRLSLL